MVKWTNHALTQLRHIYDYEEKFVIRELVEYILLKHEARRLVQKVS